MDILLMAASLRQDSLNKKLIAQAQKTMLDFSCKIQLLNFKNYCDTLYDADLEEKSGIPTGANNFSKQLSYHQALILAAPEYNYSIAAPLKNLIDWCSRVKPQPFTNYPILLLSASPALAGGSRGLWQTRIPLEGCGAFVYPTTFCLSTAHQQFSSEDELTSTELKEQLRQLLIQFLLWAQKITG